MRAIGTIEDGREARRFGDYLLTRGIDNVVEESSGGWIVWVRDEDEIDDARVELDAFLADPDNAKYTSSTGDAESIRREAQETAARRRKNIITPRNEWVAQTEALLGGRRKLGPLTLALIVACIVVAVATGLGGRANALMRALMFAPPGWADPWAAIARGEIWRLVTPIFVHFGIWHILFNMLWLRYFGAMIEGTKGTLQFAALVLVSALLSNVGQCLADGPNFGGISGVVYALFGYAWIRSRIAPTEGIRVAGGTVMILMIWFLLCLFGVFQHVANTAHTVGLASGMAWAYAPKLWRR